MSSNDRVIEFLNELHRIALTTDMRFYFVGGCVRDAFFGVPIADIDIALDGEIDDLYERLSNKYALNMSMFGTLSLTFEALQVDIAGFRREIYHGFSGLPHVMRGSLETDINRRDFTINTGYVALNKRTIQALFSGKVPPKAMVYACHDLFFHDLEARCIRTLKEDSFSEDATRMLRAVKYMVAHRLDFEMETKRQFETGIHARWMDRCSEDRYKKILLTLIGHSDWKSLVRAISKYRLFQGNADFSDAQADDLFDRLDVVYEKLGDFDMGIVFLMAAYEQKLSYWTNAPNSMSYHAKQCLYVKSHMDDNMDYLACHGLLKGTSKETIAFFHVCARCNETLRRFVIEGLWAIDVKINGKDLIELGIKEGKMVGKVKRDLLRHALESGRQLSELEELEWVESRIDEYRD